jgi:hypothetical protein
MTTARQQLGKHVTEATLSTIEGRTKPGIVKQNRRPLLGKGSLTQVSLGNGLIATELTHVYPAAGGHAIT